jgi:effector-binding domain-containing protein
MTESGAPVSAELRDLDPQPAVVVRVSAPTPSLGELFDLHLPNIADRIADLGGEPTGAPFARYHDYSAESVDVEIGIPVRAPIANLRPVEEAEPGEVAAGQLPGGRVAITVHRGDYEGLNATYGRLDEWIRAQGLAAGAGPWESYIDDPTEVDDPAQLRTEVIWPLS